MTSCACAYPSDRLTMEANASGIFMWQQCVGIELLQGLHDTSVHLLDTLHQYLQPPPTIEDEEEAEAEQQQEQQQQRKLALPFTPTCLKLSEIELCHGDLRQEDWSQADIVYVASLLFPDELMLELTDRLTKLRPGSRILTLKKLDNPELVLVHEAYYRMSWERAKVYLYNRV